MGLIGRTLGTSEAQRKRVDITAPMKNVVNICPHIPPLLTS